MKDDYLELLNKAREIHEQKNFLLDAIDGYNALAQTLEDSEKEIITIELNGYAINRKRTGYYAIGMFQPSLEIPRVAFLKYTHDKLQRLQAELNDLKLPEIIFQ